MTTRTMAKRVEAKVGRTNCFVSQSVGRGKTLEQKSEQPKLLHAKTPHCPRLNAVTHEFGRLRCSLSALLAGKYQA
jgi:hypothetical protein